MAEPILTVISYGTGEILTTFFNAVVAIMGEKTYVTLTKLTILFAGTTFIMQAILGRNFKIIMRGFATYYLATHILFLPKVTIRIEDKINLGAVHVIAGVPLGLGLITSYTSLIGGALTDMVDKNFSMPGDLKYSKTGMVMASNLVTAASQFQITDPEFAASLDSFTHQCIFYDFFLGKYSMKDLFESDDIWSLVKQQASPARAFLHKRSIVTCKEGAELLEKDWANTISQAATKYSQNLFGEKTELLSRLVPSYQYLLNISKTGEEIMRQNLMANAIQNGVVSMSAATNSPAALQSFSYVKAQLQQRLTHRTMGDLAAHWLPLMHNSIEIFLYASFIFIFLLTMLPSGLSILRNYIYSLVWLQMWAPLYAILNAIVSFYAQTRTSGSSFTLSSLSGIAQINSDMAGLAGYLSMSVPFIAGGLVKGMSGVFTQISQYVGGITQSAATSSTAEASSGNISMGNTNWGNHSAFNTSANHFNTMGSIASGGFSTQLSSGSTANMTPDGSMVLDSRPGLSTIGTNIHMSRHISNALSQQAEQSTAAAQSLTNSYSDAMSAAMRNAIDLTKHQDKSIGDTHSASISTSAGVTEAANSISQANERWAIDHNKSKDEAGKFLVDFSVRGNIGAGNSGTNVGAGAGIGGSMEFTKKYGVSYTDAKNFVLETGYAKNLDILQRATKEHGFRANNEEGQRLVDNNSSSFEKAEQIRHEINSNLQKAHNYREQASYVQQKGATIDYQANQNFVDWLSKQPGIGNATGTMARRDIDYITSGKDHELTDGYAERFIREEGIDKFIGKIQDTPVGQIAGSSSKVEKFYTDSSAAIQNQHSIVGATRAHTNEIQRAATNYGLNLDKSIVDHIPEQQADTIITNNTNEIGMFKQKNQVSENDLKNEVKNETYGYSAKNTMQGAQKFKDDVRKMEGDPLTKLLTIFPVEDKKNTDEQND